MNNLPDNCTLSQIGRNQASYEMSDEDMARLHVKETLEASFRAMRHELSQAIETPIGDIAYGGRLEKALATFDEYMHALKTDGMDDILKILKTAE